MPKLYLYGILALVVAGAFGGAYWKGRTAGAAHGEEIAQAALRDRDTALASLEASQKASKGYADELEVLRNTTPDPVIRVCRPTVVSIPVPAPGVDGTPAPAGDVQEEPGRDIGPALAREAERADRLAAQLRALQEWIRAVSE